MKTALLFPALLLALNASASDTAHQFSAVMSSFDEVPSVSSRAQAIFGARIADDEQSVDFGLGFEGLQANITQSHLHFSMPGINGPIIVWLCQTTAAPGPAGTQTCPQSGMIFGTFTSANVLAAPPTQQMPAGDLAGFIAAMRAGAVYANIHTSASPGGEIRGQVKPVR